MRTLKKYGRTLTKEQVYLDLSKLSEEEISRTRKVLYENREYVPFFTNLFDVDRYYKLHFDNGDWLCGDVTFNSKVEVTYPEFLQLFGESELTELPEEKESEKTCAGSSKMETTGTCAENQQVEEKSNEMIEGYKTILEENGYFVFPKAPEGEFPDLTDFPGVEMLCVNGQSKEYIHKDYKQILKFGDFFYGSGTAKQLGQFRSVRPIQKPKPTVDNLWKKLVEAGVDLSEFEKPE